MIEVNVYAYSGHIKIYDSLFLIDTDRESFLLSLRRKFPNGKIDGFSYRVPMGDYSELVISAIERSVISLQDFIDNVSCET